MATSKEEILKTSRVLIQQNGWDAVNIRAVAAACGISVGCIYNYFGSKTDLVSAAVESIWSDIFRHPDDPAVFEDTLSCIRWMYRQMEYGSEQYPGFFTHHALGFVRQDTADGKQQMRQTWQHILDALTMVLTRDKKIRPDAFTEEFSRQKFAGILFSLMLSAVVQQDFDPTAVLEIIRRTIYEVVKNIPQSCGSFLRPKVNNVHIDYCGTSPPAFHPRQPAHHNDAVRPAIADRIAIEQQTNRKGATFL